MPKEQKNETAGIQARKDFLARVASTSKVEPEKTQALADAPAATEKEARELLVRVYAGIGAKNHWEALSEGAKDSLAKKMAHMSADDTARLLDIMAVGGRVIKNLPIRPELIDEFVGAEEQGKKPAFYKIVEASAEQATRNRMDLKIATTMLAIGGAAGYTVAAASVGLDLGVFGLVAMTKAATTKTMVRFTASKLIDKLVDDVSDMVDEKIDEHFDSDMARLATRVLMWSAKAVSLTGLEGGSEALFDLAGYGEKEALSEKMSGALDALNLPNARENIDALASAVSGLGKNIVEKIVEKTPLTEAEMEFTKDVAIELVKDSPALGNAIWRKARRTAEKTQNGTLMLHAMCPSAQKLATGAIEVYSESGYSATDKKNCEEKASRLKTRTADIEANGLARGEIYLTLSMSDAVFGKYLTANTTERVALLKEHPPLTGEVKAAAMTSWEDMNVSGGALGVKISTVVMVARLMAVGSKGLVWAGRSTSKNVKKLEGLIEASMFGTARLMQQIMPSLKASDLAPLNLRDRLKMRRGSNSPAAPTTNVHKVDSKRPPAP